MLPYTPLHYLLLERAADFPPALVMTSGNFSEEPIATDDADALARLAPLCDAFLLHDRPIHIRCDDSVVRPMRGRIVPLRRSRGYAPYPVPLPFDAPPLLATGAEMKNTFCVARDRSAFMSQHIGELGNYDARRSFERSVEHLSRLYRVEPKIVAHDAHPDYAATRYALGGPSRRARCSTITRTWQLPGGAPRPARQAAIGVIFDGTAWGRTARIWGGEVLIGGYDGYARCAHLRYIPLPGGDAARCARTGSRWRTCGRQGSRGTATSRRWQRSPSRSAPFSPSSLKAA